MIDNEIKKMYLSKMKDFIRLDGEQINWNFFDMRHLSLAFDHCLEEINQ
jgi:hypothetical protein